MKTKIVTGIEYKLPKATLLHATPLVNAELAGRTAYNSFNKSEHKEIQEFNGTPISDIEHSNILDSLCHVYHHMSVAEHINLTYRITTSRGVLQEQARHRIQSLTVQSTRYTMSPIINAFIAHLPLIAEQCLNDAREAFVDFLESNINYLITNSNYNVIEHTAIWDKLIYQYYTLDKEEFMKTFTSKDMRTNGSLVYSTPENRFRALQASKQKRNVGDAAKHIVTDNWKVDMVVTFNLRSLKNYFDLRDNGAAYWQIQEVARAMKEVTPQKYLDLIIKK